MVFYHLGQRHEKVVQGKKRDAEEYEARWRLELQGADPVDPRTIPAFSDFCVSRYRPHAERHLKASTWQNVRIYQVDTLCKRLGHLRLTEVGAPAEIERFKAEMGRTLVKRHGKLRPMLPSSINNLLRVLRTILNWARELGYPIPKQKWAKLPARGKPRTKAWTDGEVQALFEACQARYPELVPMFVFLVNTGCRKGEAIVAERSWMDWEAMMLRIPSNEFWQPKNGLPREVPIADVLRAVVGPSTAALHAGTSRYLFPSRTGDRYAEFPKDIFWEIRDLAGVTGSPHTFRHTFASHFLRGRPDLFLLAQLMGHSHARVTELYSHMLPDHLARARNVVNVGPKLKTLGATLGAEKKTGRITGKTK